jgi:hypothetical protein
MCRPIPTCSLGETGKVRSNPVAARRHQEAHGDPGDDPAGWEKPREDIEMSSQGAAVTFNIPWQNRGTHNHVIEVLSDGD